MALVSTGVLAAGALALGGSWQVAVGLTAACLLLMAAKRFSKQPGPPRSLAAEAPQLADQHTSASRKKRLRKKPAPGPQSGEAVGAQSVDAGHSEGEAPSPTDNPFAALASDYVAPQRPQPGPTKGRRAAVAATLPPPPVATLPSSHEPPSVRSCEISLSVACHEAAHGGAALANMRRVAVRDNAVLTALLRRRAGRENRLKLTPGESFITYTDDAGRYEFELIRQDERHAELWQYALHFEGATHQLIRINQRRVRIGW